MVGIIIKIDIFYSLKIRLQLKRFELHIPEKYLNFVYILLDYKIIVGQGLKYLGSQQCYDRVEEAFIQLEDLMRTKQSDLLQSKLNCPAISTEIVTESDAHSLHEFIFENFAYLVQYQGYSGFF